MKPQATALALALAGAASLASGPTGESAPPASPTPAFEGPRVIELDWSTRALTVTDFNGDGRNDLVVANNDSGKIELLRQLGPDEAKRPRAARVNANRWNPVFGDADFDRETISVGFPVFDLAAGDLNGDGRVDLAYTGRDEPLTVRYQNEEGAWPERHVFDRLEALGWTETLAIGDLRGDGRGEVVALASKAIHVVRAGEEREGELRAERYPLTGDNPFDLTLADVTNDQRLDILYGISSEQASLVLREQIDGGGGAGAAFGPEQRFPFDQPVRQFKVLNRAADEPLFAAVDSRAGALEFFRLRRPGNAPARSLFRARPEIYPMFSETREPAAHAAADIDGDGRLDFVAAPPKRAEILLFRGREKGFAAARRFPSFSRISSLAAGKFHAEDPPELVVISQREESIGVSALAETGRLTFPRGLKAISDEGRPLVCAAGNFAGGPADELAVVVESEKATRLLLARPARAAQAASWDVIFEMELPVDRRTPEALVAADCFGGGRAGLIVLTPREPSILLRPKSGDATGFELAGAKSPIANNVLEDVRANELAFFDADGSPGKELVVAKTGFARAIRVADDGSLEMVEQYNARRSEDEVAAVIPRPNAENVERLLFYIANTGELQRLERGQDGVFRYREARDAGKIALTGWRAFPGGDSLLFAGSDRFWVLGAQTSRREREIDRRHESGLEDVEYSHVNGGDFDGDGRLGVLALDGEQHVVELLEFGPEADLESHAHWNIFEENMHYQGREGSSFEPRENVAADLTGDGRLDFALLVHDRVLIYPAIDEAD